MTTNTIAKAREQKIFVMKETTRGTLVAPTDTGLIIAAGYVTKGQQPSYTDSEEVQDTLDIMDQFIDRLPAGTLSIPVYLRPSGTAGTAPQEDVLLESVFGLKTINAGVSVVYSPAKTKCSFSIWAKKGHAVFWLAGCVSESIKTGLKTTGAAKAEIPGKFMRMGWAGTCETQAVLAAADTSIEVANAKKYTVGSFVEFEVSGVVKNNTDAGYEITAVNATTNIITFTGDPAEEEIASGSVVRGWLPDGTEVGSPVENMKGSAEIDGSGFSVNTMEVSVGSPVKMLDDEITASGYIEDYSEMRRDISYDLSIYFRENDLQYYHDGLNSVEKTLKMIIGDTEGSIIEIYSQRTIPKVPSLAESDPTIALQCSARALGTSGEDSISMTYK